MAVDSTALSTSHRSGTMGDRKPATSGRPCSTSSAARPHDVLQLQVDAHGPQWGRRVRVQMGSAGHLRGHGTCYVSEQFATVLEHLVLTAATGLTVRVVDRSGAEPMYMTSVKLTTSSLVLER